MYLVELYESDADIGHQLFDLKMTDRVNMRMVGVPEASFDGWAARFVAKGYVDELKRMAYNGADFSLCLDTRLFVWTNWRI